MEKGDWQRQIRLYGLLIRPARVAPFQSSQRMEVRFSVGVIGASGFQGVESREVAGVDFRLFAVVPCQCVPLPLIVPCPPTCGAGSSIDSKHKQNLSDHS